MNTPETTADVVAQIDRLRLRCHRAGRAQYIASQTLRSMHYRLGIPAVVLSAIVGTTIFSTLATDPALVVLIITGLLSVGSAVLAGLQTFFGYAERAEKHRSAGAQYGGIKRRLDLLRIRVSISGSIDQALADLAALVDEINALEGSVPDVADWMYDQARKEQQRDSEGV